MTTVYYNGNIYTEDSNFPKATAFAVRDGKFIYVGDDAGAGEYGAGTNLNGATVIPGLIDSHCHILTAASGDDMDMLFISPALTPDDIGAAILDEYRKAHGGEEPHEDKIIRAMGIELQKGNYNCRMLDKQFPNQPVYVFSDDGHALLLNSCAMKVCHVDRNIQDPAGGCFVRDADGEPTGIVLEIPAMMMCAEGFKPKCTDKTRDSFLLLQKLINSLGITTVFDAATITGEDLSILDILKKIESEGLLTLRVGISHTYMGEESLPGKELAARLLSLKEQYGSDLLSPFVLKMIPDGTVEEHSAFMNDDYTDDPGNNGMVQIDFKEMQETATLAAVSGLDIHIHAIGDAAIEKVLEIYKGLGQAPVHKTIAHNHVYSEKALKLLDENKDVFFNTTPHWVKADDYTEKYIGENRFRHQFPVGTAVRKGLTVTFSSDSAAGGDEINPFIGLYYAVKRGDGDEGVTFPQAFEGITLEEALKCYTINGAKQLGLEDRTGSIEAGKDADFVILDRDIFNIDIEEVKAARPVATYFRGEKL